MTDIASIEHKNNQNALRIIKEIIQKLENSDNWPNHGICGMVTNIGQEMFDSVRLSAAREVISELTKEWSHYSGSVSYPVPSNIVGLPQETASTVFGEAVSSVDGPRRLWSETNPYGYARRNLLQFLHDQLAMRVNEYQNQNSTRYEQDGQSLGHILSAALNNHNERTTAMNNNIDTNTIEGKIAVMQAALDGKKIEYRHSGDNTWKICQEDNIADLGFHWGAWEYRIYQEPKTKDTFDFAGLNQKWKYAARDISGSLYLYDKKPEIEGNVWSIDGFQGEAKKINELFDTYKIGDVDWKDSLISRDEVDTLPRHITDLIRNGNFISAIKEHRLYFGTGLREAKDACDAWREANIPNWRSNLYR